LRPDPFAREREQRRALSLSVNRAIASVALSPPGRAKSAEAIVAREWPKDKLAGMIVKAALAGPMTTTSTGLPQVTSVDVLPFIAPQSAAMRVFAKCTRVNLDTVSQIAVPVAAPGVVPPYVGEGGRAPVVKLSFTTAKIGPVRKILVASAVTGELESLAADTASDIVAQALANAATTRSLDSTVFDSAADDGIRPAGLLFGLSTVDAATAGGGLAAISGDLGKLVGAISAAGIYTDDLIIVTNPVQRVSLKTLLPGYDGEIITSPQIPAGRVIAIAPSAVASGYSGLPTIEKSTDGVFHYEDANPQNIGTAGTPAVVATPAQSAFQADLIAIRVRIWSAYGVIAPGGVAYIDNVTW
jgi:hypothetical protein